jgi:DmsE family decaheme c-type cytochrome
VRIKWVFLSVALFSTAGFAQSGFVGSDRCAVCHEPQAKAFARNVHKSGACETCHGPGLAHVEALDPAKLAVFAGGQPDTINRSCLGCHASDKRQAHRFQSPHAKNGISCSECHSVHSPDVKRSSDALCAKCHSAVRASFERPFGHKLTMGAVHCGDCHDPHGTPPPTNVKHRVSNETACIQCHTEKRGPFLFEHAPVRVQPCVICHEPHGSNNPRMLTRSNVSQLCLECHTVSQTNAGGSPPSFHDLRTARYRNCTVCHSKTHGSYVNRDFLR